MNKLHKGTKNVGGTSTSRTVVQFGSRARPQVRRVSFLVSDSVFNDLKELTGPDETMTDVFKKAVAAFKYLETKKREGKRFFIGEAPDRIESEVVLLR